MKIDKFILMGHSFGGYIATCYSHKYQNHLNSLVLLSPVGFSELPLNFDKKKYISEFGNVME